MLAISSKINHTNYDIDGFISQILKSHKFDELSEKLAEKAAKKILSIQGTSGSINKFNSNHGDSIKDTQKKSVDEKLRKDYDKKIDPKDVFLDDATLQPENLKLNYKYLTKQAVMKANMDPEVDPIKDNRETEIAEKKHYGNKTMAGTSNREVAKENLIGAKKQLSNENRHLLDKRKHVDERKYTGFSDNEDTNDNSKKRQLTQHGGRSEHSNSNESKNSGPQFKDILKLGASKGNNERKKESIRKFLSNSEDRSEEARRQDTESDGDKDSGAFQLRNQEESSDYNKVTSDSVYSPYRGGDRSPSSENGSRSVRKEQSPEERTREQQDGDTKFRPVIKREGGKLYRYVEAPEYKDYHEDMLKWRKVHPENPADFMP